MVQRDSDQKTLMEFLSSGKIRTEPIQGRKLPVEKTIEKKKIRTGNFIFREDLEKPKNLKVIFNSMRNHLAGNFKGTTRDERLAEQLIFLLFSKIIDEIETDAKSPLLFQIKYPDERDVTIRINCLFNRLKTRYSYVFSENDEILADKASLTYIVKELQNFCITEASRDSIGDAFEIFLGPSLRGNKGQFFTPKNVVKTIIQIIDPEKGEKIIDPACGTGGFLIEAVSYLIRQNGYQNINNFKKVISDSLFGIDKDSFLAKIAGIYLLILGVSKNNVFCDNSLEITTKWNESLRNTVKLGDYDIVITNPPFGSKIPIKDVPILSSFDLGYKWQKKKDGSWIKGNKTHDKQPPQILFIERCLQLLKPGGRMGIVLPDGIFGNPSDRYILNYIFQKTKIQAVISCSHLTFLPHTHTKTSLLFLKKEKPTDDYEFLMAIAENVGHDKNGKPLYKMDKAGTILKDHNGNEILNDDFPVIINRFRKFLLGEQLDHSHLGFLMKFSKIKDHILIPEFYNPEINEELRKFEKSGGFKLVTLGNLVKKEIVEIRRGNEIGSRFYGTGNVPFVRTSDLINWEINIDPKKQVSEEIYQQYRDKQDIKNGDILLVSDGTFLIGKSAMVTEKDEKILIQSHLKKLRVLNKDLINEYILLWLLNTDIVQKQIVAKTFVQSTISTLGNRILELVLPIPIKEDNKQRIRNETSAIIREKMLLKQRMRELIKFIENNYDFG